MPSTPPSLRGMMLFTTSAEAESLVSTSCTENPSNHTEQREKNKGEQPTSAEVLFNAMKQELTRPQCVQHTLFSSIHVEKGGSREGLVYRCVSLQRPSNVAYSSCQYLVNLDHLYRTGDDMLNEAHQWWLTALKGIQRDSTYDKPDNSDGVEWEKPEIILIVLPPTDTQMRRRPGSMLPSLVRLGSENAVEGVGDTHIRLCGLPHHVNFRISAEQLQCLSSSCGLEKTRKSGSGWDWLILQPKEIIVSHTWCTMTFISDEFITHSLFFLEWCIPGDFVWSSQQPSAGGWGCDILGKLLRDITSQRSHAVDYPTHVNHHPVSKRHRSEDAEAFVDMVSNVPLETVDTTECLECAKRDVDMRFVEMVYAKTAAADRELTVRGLLGQLTMMEEAHTVHAMYQSSDTTTNTGGNANHSRSTITFTKQTLRVLREWEKLQESRQNNSSFYHHGEEEEEQQQQEHIPPSLLEGVEKKRTVRLFLEMLKQQLLLFNRRNTARVLQFTGDGEKLLEAPRIAEEMLHVPQQDAIELADVAQLRMTMGRDINSFPHLPYGPLRGMLEASAAAYATSTFHGYDETMKPNTCSSYTEDDDDDEEEAGARENDDTHPCDYEIGLLEVVGKSLLDAVDVFAGNGGDANNKVCWTVEDVIQRVWTAITEYLGGEGSDMMVSNKFTSDGNDRAPGNPTGVDCRADWMQSLLKRAASCCATAPAVKDMRDRRNLLWLSHAAFLISHAAVPNSTTNSPPPTCIRCKITTGVEHSRRIVRALEAHSFFLDAAICAADSVILRRWREARDALQQGEKRRGKVRCDACV